VVWGFFCSTVFLWHVTWAVNSVNHTWGSRRFETGDTSTNNYFVGILALGEGFHNNHHANPGFARQGLFWWELDVTYYVLWLLSRTGLVWDLRVPTAEQIACFRKLEDVRRTLETKSLAPADLSSRLEACQKALIEAAQKAARAQKAIRESFRQKLIDAQESAKRLRDAIEEFRARMHTAAVSACGS
jgi:hypothetical protein